MKNLKEDRLTGASQIADFIGESVRSTYYMLERRLLPGFKRGGVWESRKSTIIADTERREREAQA